MKYFPFAPGNYSWAETTLQQDWVLVLSMNEGLSKKKKIHLFS